ncbi:MAG: hypothetical protein IPK26_21355 [Planctomycetes bacterium]|nr:hypothetical protein [Planctomycetota bacterium]
MTSNPRKPALLAFSVVFLAATTASNLPLLVPTDVQMPGTQPGQAALTGNVSQCNNCHANYDAATEPSRNWQGSMMSHSGRDPLFWAALGVVESDYAGAGDFCLRCHAPRGWLEGRSASSDGSGLASTTDANGIECTLCHALVNPSGTEHAGVQNAPFVANDGGSPAQGYHGSGMMVVSGNSTRYGPYANAAAQHATAQSQFHRSSSLCGTCHDVSNPFVGDLAHNHGAQVPLAPGRFSGVPGTPVSGKAAFLNFPHQYGIVERTFSEHAVSAFANLRVRDFATLPADLQRGSIRHAWQQAQLAGNQGDYADGTTRNFSCQSCHMAPVVGQGANGGPMRSDLPLHDLTGGNTRVPEMIKWLDAQGRLKLGGGLTAAQTAAIDDGVLRARASLQRAAALDVQGDLLKVVNLTGHKLITGYPEGRRMWLRMRWRNEQGALLREDGGYGPLTIAMGGLPSTVDTLLDPNARVYQATHGMTQEWANQLLGYGLSANLPLMFDRVTGNISLTLGQLAAQAPGSTHETFHFLLNNMVLADSRIPPYGYPYDAARTRNALPVPATQYGNPGPGGTFRYWDELTLNPPAGATRADIELLYQTTSWEYVQFLFLANAGPTSFLATVGWDALDAWLNTGMSAPEVMATTNWCRLPGTGEDLRLRSGIDGATPDITCAKSAGAGQAIRLVMDSPNATFGGALAAVIFQFHTPGAAPVPLFPGLQLSQIDGLVTAIPLGAGAVHDIVVPSGMVPGSILRAQAIVLANQAQNGVYATSGAHDLTMR